MSAVIWCGVLALVCVLACVLRAVVKWQNSRVRLTEYTVRNAKIPPSFDGFSLFVISDLHDSPFAEQIETLVRQTAPDVLLFTGDLVFGDKTVDLGVAGKLLDALGGQYPVYGVSGNHEGDETPTIAAQFRARGGIWLDDRRETLTRGEESIFLTGIGDRSFAKIECAEKEILTVMQRTAADGYTVTLCHNPIWYRVLKDSETDLVLSGHEHGGLIRLPLLGGMFGHEGQRLFPKYCLGRYRDGRAELIVSGGCDNGTHYPRLNSPPEVLLVRLRSTA